MDFPIAFVMQMSATALAGVAMGAMLIDHLFGEPKAAVHPVVWVGKYLSVAGRHVFARDRSNGAQFLLGAIWWWVGASVVVCIAIAIQTLLLQLSVWIAIAIASFALKPMLAWRMLREEALAVEAALGVSLDAGRAALSRLVSRDVSALTSVEVRESAIESLAENLNDSVIAPLFWFALLGLPGAVLYRFANTADAMWGYRGKWEYAGKFAARADDVLSCVPARITALLLMIGMPSNRKTNGKTGTKRPTRKGQLGIEARQTPSPNSGWPMAAMALALGIRLSKPGVYVLNLHGRDAWSADTFEAVALAWRAVLIGLASMLVLSAAEDFTRKFW